MSTSETNATMTTTITGPLTSASSPASIADAAEDEDEPAALAGFGDMDLVNGPNSWLPAYGFQLQHHSHFQPTHEDLRANDTVLVQQVDFLETILEETSDDLQSDSDRSGTTYWLSSDSETESVIHIRAKQRSADGSGSECNSVVPKKRRRRNNGTSDRDHRPPYEDYPVSPRSSRSSASSRSSSLLQFESLERTCATLSPSSYSFDSLEYSNRSNASHPENTSPDSLEQDYDRALPNGLPENATDRFTRIRPYRSFESLDTCQKEEEEFGQHGLTNGFAPLYLKRNRDLSRTGSSGPRSRDFWHDEEEYEDAEEEELDDEDRVLSDNRSGFEERLMVFGDNTCNYATSLDYRNTIDLREIGIETKRDALLDLKSESNSLRMLQARLNISGGMVSDQHPPPPHHHHHHPYHHHHHQQPQQQQYQHHQQPHGYEHREQQRQHQQHRQRQGWSKEECFNFRFTDKSQSAPSLPSSVDESAHSPRFLAARASSRTTSFVSTSNLFENYTRVASVPVDLNLCGSSPVKDEPEAVSLREHEMAEVTSLREKKRLESLEENGRLRNGEDEVEVEEEEEEGEGIKENEIGQTKAGLMSSVRTQAPQGILVDGKMNHEEGTRIEEECVDGHCERPQEKKQVTSTVKTQDRSNCVLDMAIAMENDIDTVVDEAIKQFKREVEEATVGGNNSLGMDGIQRTASGRQRSRRVKNNASYELAQHFEIDERNFRPNRYRTRRELANEEKSPDSPRGSGRKRVLNNASYELAQQYDYVKALTASRGAFQRMDACDELEEPISGRSSRLMVSDMVQQMSSSSASNLATDHGEPVQTRRYSKSTENVSNPFMGGTFTRVSFSQLRPRRQEDETLLGQIKKNSDPFSIYGEDTNAPPFVDDEVDYPCLEIKPIEASSLEGSSRSRENTAQNQPNLPYESPRGSSNREPGQKQEEENSSIHEQYPENPPIVKQYPQKSQMIQESSSPVAVTDDLSGTEERLKSPSSEPNDSGRSWRVVVEPTVKEEKLAKEVTVKEAKEDKKEEEKKEEEEEEEEEGTKEVEQEEEKEEAAVVAVTAAEAAAARGQSVHGVRGSPPRSNSSSSSNSRLELGERSGNPAAAVAVDTNHRADRNKRHEENAPARTAWRDEPRMSTTAKQTFAAAKKDPSVRFQRNVDGAAAAGKEERKKSGLGGFLQRFSRLRFSGRSKVPRSEVQKKSDTLSQVNRAKVPEDERKKEPDYIIIPLHPPEEERRKNELVTLETKSDTDGRSNADVQRSGSNVSSNGRAPVSSKPPLPPQPPRVGALRQLTAASSVASAAAAAASSTSRRRAATDLGNPAAIEMAKARTMQAAQERPVGLLETDLDEVVPSTTSTVAQNAPGKKTRSLLNLNHTSTAPRPRPENALHIPQSPVAASHRNPRDDGTASINQRPHKSMEFLLDKENLHFVKPPENELQKVGERIPSEHELRVQRSLQRLNVPDWYKNSPAARDGFRLKRHSDASQHGGWRALGSKTTSLSSLSSSSNRQPTTGALLSPSPTPPVFSRWSTSLLNSAGSSPASSARSSFNHRQPYLGWRSQERLTNPRTPAERLAQGILPQLQAANKQQQQQQQQQTTNQQLEVRNSIKEVTSAIVHYVQSGQEVGGGGRLSPRPRPEDWDDRGGARSTSPRGSVKLCWMESSFVGTRPVDSPETPMSLATETDCCNATGTESCSCIDSATSGLFLDLTPTRDDVHQQHQHQQLQQQSQQQLGGGLCPSPSSSLNFHHQHHHHRQHHHQQQQQQQQQQQRHHRGSGQSDTDEAMATAALLRNKPSPGSTTLEDVLDSLLGLPSASRTPSPGPGGPPVTGSTSMRHRANVGQPSAKPGKSCSDLRQDLQESAKSVLDVQGASEERGSHYSAEMIRRKSEGSDTITSRNATMQSRGGHLRHRRVSFDNQDANGFLGPNAGDKIVRCRNNKCTNSTTLAEARKTYKSCHNCTCLYCSRECRRAHWQRHRKTCLHSRAGSLCRQVLSSAKEDATTLKHISALAKRGYASHGRGAVKCFFSSPEAAEKFIGNGFVDLGEPTYVRWSDLLATEMGAELYAEVMRLCKSYNPETRLVLYVAVCVVSEVPTSGAVKWERQLVSRCAKIHLDSASRHHASPSASPQGRQPTSPCNITREMESPEMLVLTSLPGNNGQNTPKRAREISFTNIQRQLKLRGVSLRRHFPQVYKKLRAYVDGTVDKFAPVTIYPRDQASGKSFMCIIMLDVEPERLQLLPTDSSRVRTVDISVEQE